MSPLCDGIPVVPRKVENHSRPLHCATRRRGPRLSSLHKSGRLHLYRRVAYQRGGTKDTRKDASPTTGGSGSHTTPSGTPHTRAERDPNPPPPTTHPGGEGGGKEGQGARGEGRTHTHLLSHSPRHVSWGCTRPPPTSYTHTTTTTTTTPRHATPRHAPAFDRTRSASAGMSFSCSRDKPATWSGEYPASLKSMGLMATQMPVSARR